MKSKNPLEMFFSLGEKVTGGDPKKLLDFNYYMLWIMFLAFFTILISNLIEFYNFQKLHNLGWSFVMLAILWFQYNGLKQTYEARKLFNLKQMDLQPMDQMLEEFKDLKGGETQKMNTCEICKKQTENDVCKECIDSQIDHSLNKDENK